jgi:hypothetical protein
MAKTLGVSLDAVDVNETVTPVIVAGAIPIVQGTVTLGSAGALAMTLAAPVAGGPGVGDDGKKIYVVAVTAQAHTVTTPANKLNGNKSIATYAAVGDGVEFEAVNGAWVTRGLKGAVIT